jgi:hypothetical protein
LTLKPMVDEMNWTRSDLGVAVGVFQVVTAFAMFWSGRLADRASLRALLGWGLIVSGASLGAMSLVTQPWHALVLFGIVYAFANGLISVSPVGVMVTRAFPTRAGFANGVASAGMSVGQLVIIAIMAAVLVGIGWRSGLRLGRRRPSDLPAADLVRRSRQDGDGEAGGGRRSRARGADAQGGHAHAPVLVADPYLRHLRPRRFLRRHARRRLRARPWA